MRCYTSFDEQLPLTEDERECLLHIYKHRRKILHGAFGVLGVLALIVSHPWALTPDDYYPVSRYRSRYGSGEATW